MATIHVIDQNKKSNKLELTPEQYSKLCQDAQLASLSPEEMAIIHMTNGKTSRFAGQVTIELP